MTPQELVAQARSELAVLRFKAEHAERDCDGCGHVSVHAFSFMDDEWVCLDCRESEIASMADAAATYVPGENDRELLKDAGRPR